MRVQVLTAPPENLVFLAALPEGYPLYVDCTGFDLLNVFFLGGGTTSVDLYTYQEDTWLKHPQSDGIVNNGSYCRFVISSAQQYACLVSSDGSPVSDEAHIIPAHT